MQVKPKLMKKCGEWYVYHYIKVWGGMTYLWLTTQDHGFSNPQEAWEDYVKDKKDTPCT